MQTIDANGAVINSAMARQLIALTCLRVGPVEETRYKARMNKRMEKEWLNNASIVQQIENPSGRSTDYKYTPTFAGLPILTDDTMSNRIQIEDLSSNPVSEIINLGESEWPMM